MPVHGGFEELGANAIGIRLHRYALLLALLLLALIVQAIDVSTRTASLLSDVSRTVLGVTVLFVVFERPRERIAMAVVLAIVMAIAWSPHFLSGNLGRGSSIALHALTVLYVSVAALVIVRDLFRHPPTGAENVLGAICGYLLAADAWASVNALAYLLAPAAYEVNADVGALLADWRGRLALFAYYSYAQMLTIGYPEVTPLRAPATLLSVLAALFGIFYTAVVVSQLVALAQLIHRKKA